MEILTINKEIKRRNKPSKEQRYTKERQELIEKLNMIIGIDENKINILLCEIENETIKEKIRENIPEIQKYFKCGTWNYFKNSENRNEIGLLKSVYNNYGYIITSKKRMININNIKKQCTELYFIKKQ